jgi:hypothetical protein
MEHSATNAISPRSLIVIRDDAGGRMATTIQQRARRAR